MKDQLKKEAPPKSPPADSNGANSEKPCPDDFEQTFTQSVEAIEKRNGKPLSAESKFLFHRELWNARHRT